MKMLKPMVKLSYPEFNSHYIINEALGWSLAYSFKEIDGKEWFKMLVNRIFDARDNKQYLPVYRMGDGEYRFLLKKNILELLPFHNLTWKQKIRKIMLLLKSQEGHVSGTLKDGVEIYTKAELVKIYNKYVDDIKDISKDGILALGMDTGNFYGKYVPYVLQKFNELEIFLSEKNYYHVYHIYALFSSTYGEKLLNNQNVLIITSLNEIKKKSFKSALLKKGVKRVDFYSISSNKAMLENIDLNKIAKDINLVLIGAGVGSANILVQLKNLSVPCLDIGTILGNYLNPDRKFDRPFMLTDSEFDLEKVRFLSRKQKEKVKKFINKV